MKLSVFFILVLLVFPDFSQNLTVEISGINTSTGLIQLSLYHDCESFKAETPFRICNFDKAGMTNGNLTVFITDLEPGNYGIALVDDKNSNGRMDFRFFVPTEGFGFSNYQFQGTRKPDFQAFDFTFPNGDQSIQIKVQYIAHQERECDSKE